ncbi:MAG: hypothetical protein R2864_13345 [Syntrophotaleaceae bacterium]
MVEGDTNKGVALSTGRTLLFLHADSQFIEDDALSALWIGLNTPSLDSVMSVLPSLCIAL